LHQAFELNAQESLTCPSKLLKHNNQLEEEGKDTNSTTAMEINASNFFTSDSCFDNDSSKDDSFDPISGTNLTQQSIDPIHFWSTRTVAPGSDAKLAGGDLSVISGVYQHTMEASDPSVAVGAQEVPLLTDFQLLDSPRARKRRDEVEQYDSFDSATNSHEESDDHHEETAANCTKASSLDLWPSHLGGANGTTRNLQERAWRFVDPHPLQGESFVGKVCAQYKGTVQALPKEPTAIKQIQRQSCQKVQSVGRTHPPVRRTWLCLVH
jgi:hypothetical protein